MCIRDRDYCAYVRRYSLKEYSPAVQKVMNYVNLNVAEPLTLLKVLTLIVKLLSPIMQVITHYLVAVHEIKVYALKHIN